MLLVVLLLLQELSLILSQSVNVAFKNATDIIYLTSMNDNKEYHEWFDMTSCSVIRYNSINSDDDYYWVSVGGLLNGHLNASDDTIQIMSDIYDINIDHNNNPNLPFIITDAEIYDGGQPKLGTSIISNTIIQCYVYHIKEDIIDNMAINCTIFNQTRNAFITNPAITVSNIFAANPEDATGDEMYWGLDVLCFDDDTFFITYIASNSFNYTLLHSNGTIITFNKLLYYFGKSSHHENDALFLIKSHYNMDSTADFINSFLLYYTDQTATNQSGVGVGVWTGIYSENYSLKLNTFQPILEMQTDERCYSQKPILMEISKTCCYVLPYSYGQWNEIDYAVINATGQRAVSNDIQLFTVNNMYQFQELIPLQHKNNHYFLSLMPYSQPSDEYLHLYAYIFSLTKLTNKNDPYNQYELNIIGNQTFVNQLYNDSFTNDQQIYGICGTLSSNNEHLFLSWVSQACYGNQNLFESTIYAQSWNISWDS